MKIPIFATSLRRDARVVEWGGLENRCLPIGGPGVRIPFPPQTDKSKQKQNPEIADFRGFRF